MFWNCGTDSLLTCENVWMNHRQKRRDERLNWRFFFRTSNGQRCSQQPVGLRRDGAVISWQRGAGRVGTARLTSKPGRPRESWRRTHSFCLCKNWPSKKQKMESRIRLDCWTLQKQCERSGDHWESLSNEWWRGSLPPSCSPLMSLSQRSGALISSCAYCIWGSRLRVLLDSLAQPLAGKHNLVPRAALRTDSSLEVFTCLSEGGT